MAFWEALQRHQRWQRENLPGIDTSQGMALLIWLLKNGGRAHPIGELYKESRSSEPTMREAVKLFVEVGLAALEFDGRDSRRRLLGGTPKLEQTVRNYREQLALLVREA